MSRTNLSYFDQINLERSTKDELFKNPRTSPLTSSSLDSFAGLDYYPVDERFIITGSLIPEIRISSVQLAASSGKSFPVEKYGVIRFQFDGKTQELTVFKTGSLSDFVDLPGQLFIPFKDLTSGKETHHDGRYLLITTENGNDKVELDFNRAFNPKSAYNTAFESIIAPESNVTGLSFTVGQRKFEDRK